MYRRAGAKTDWVSRWPGFGITTGTRMASWQTKTCRTGQPPLHLRRNSAARTALQVLLTAGRLGRSGAAPLRGPVGRFCAKTHTKNKRDPRKRLALGLYCASQRRLSTDAYSRTAL